MNALEAYWTAAAHRAGVEIEDMNEPPPKNDVKAPPKVVTEHSAKRLIEMLLKAGAIELEEGASLEAFATDLDAMLTDRPSGSALSEWLLERDEVGELYLDEEQLEKIMRAW